MTTNYRQERIERLLQELRYEVQRGMMDGEVDESLGFRFYVPVSKSLQGGVVFCEFLTRPLPAWHVPLDASPCGPRLKVVK